MAVIPIQNQSLPVKNPSQHPFNTVVRLLSRIKQQNQMPTQIWGCGVIINPRIIITAACNVCFKGQIASIIEVQPKTQQKNKILVKWVGIHKLYLDLNFCPKSRNEINIAILILEENDLIKPNMVIAMNKNYNFQSDKAYDIIISGYLRQQQLNQFFFHQQIKTDQEYLMIYDKRKPSSVNNRLILYSHSTSKGYGGTPLILQTKDNFGSLSHTMIGIHIGLMAFKKYGLLTTDKNADKIVELAQNLNISDSQDLQQIVDRLKITEKLDNQLGYLCGKDKQTLAIYNNIQFHKLIVPQSAKNKKKDKIESRLWGHFGFRINEVIVHNIRINQQILYFEPFDSKTTIYDLSRQYLQLAGKHLNLTYSNFSIPKDKLITQIIYQLKDETKLEYILNQMQKQSPILTKQNIEWLQKTNKQWKAKEQSLIKKPKIGWNCQIIINHYEQQIKAINYKAQSNTTIFDVIKFVENRIKINLQNIQIVDQNKVSIRQQNYDRTFSQLKIENSSLVMFVPAPNCYFKSNSVTLVKNQNIILKPIKDLVSMQAQNYKIPNIMSFNRQKKLLEQSELSNSKQIEGASSYFRIQVQTKQQEYKQEQEEEEEQFADFYSPSFIKALEYTLIQCSPNVMLLTEDKGWMICSKLKPGQKVLCCSGHKYELEYCPVTSIQFKQIDQKAVQSQRPRFYTLSSEPHHNLIINRIVCYNRNSIKIKVYQYKHQSNNQKLSCRTMSVYHDDVIESKFKDKFCMIGGVQVNNKCTFGDYQIERFRILFVSDNSFKSINNVKQLFLISDGFQYDYFAQSDCNHQSNFKKQANDELSLNRQFSQKLFQWQNDYLGIYEQRIIALSQQQLQKISKSQKLNHLLIDYRGNLQLFNYLYNIYPVYSTQSNLQFKDTFIKTLGFNPNSIHPLDFYFGKSHCYIQSDPKTKQPVPNYKAINDFFRNQYSKPNSIHQIKTNSNHQSAKYLCATAWINQSLQKLPNFSGTIYRGIGNIDISTFLSNCLNQSMVFLQFTSATKEKSIAQKFMYGTTQLLITIKVTTAKYVKQWSHNPEEQQVLIPPFSYFRIVDKNYKANSGEPYLLQTLTLQQIPLPMTSSKRIIFWVDDNPLYNIKSAQKFRKAGIEVVEVLSTEIMEIILEKFFWIYKLLGSQILIISDMARLQGEELNKKAGIDLFNKIYGEYGLSNKGIIFCGNANRTKNEFAKYQNLTLEHIEHNQKWFITSYSDDLEKQVYKFFDIAPKQSFEQKMMSSFKSMQSMSLKPQSCLNEQ